MIDDWTRATLLTLALLLAAPGCVPASELRGTVAAVSDGDSVSLRDAAGQVHRIRVADIDAPEQGQPYSRAARQRLIDLCLRERATVRVRDIDSYGRAVGSLACNGHDAGSELVRWGLAWVYLRYAPEDSPLHALEQAARQQRRGLWSDRAPVAPWTHRQAQARAFSSAPDAGSASQAAIGPIRGNRNSKIYHLPHCPSFDAVSPRNRVGFATEAQAQQQGYRRARNCR